MHNLPSNMSKDEALAMATMLTHPDMQSLPSLVMGHLGQALPLRGSARLLQGTEPQVRGNPLAGLLAQAGARAPVALPQAMGVAGGRQGPVNPLSFQYGTPQSNGGNQ